MTAHPAPPAENLVSEAELLRLSAGDTWYEVVNGELVPVSAAGFLHTLVISNIYDLLKPYVSAQQLGYILPDGLHCILDAGDEGIRGSRIPDVAFIRAERLPTDFDFNRPFPGAPDLAVEVVSPTEGDDSIDEVCDYLDAGSVEVWVAYPRTREVHRYTQDTPKLIQVYTEEDHIDSQALFPGLSLPIAAFFDVRP